MVGRHQRLNGHEFQHALGVGDGQGSLACCSLWSCKESYMTELNLIIIFKISGECFTNIKGIISYMKYCRTALLVLILNYTSFHLIYSIDKGKGFDICLKLSRDRTGTKAEGEL